MRIAKILGSILLIVLALLIVFQAASYLDSDRSGFLFQNYSLKGSSWYKFTFYGHIFLGAIALLVGPFQFIQSFRQKAIQIHRKLGYVYIIACLVSGVFGFVISFFALGNWVSKTGFACLAIMWLLTTTMAFRTIKAGDIPAHRRWMLRSYSLTFAGVSLRLLLGIFVALAGIKFIDAYLWLSWACWVPNLFFTELFICRELMAEKKKGKLSTS